MLAVFGDFYFTGSDVVDPTGDGQLACSHGCGHGRVRLEVLHLEQDVLLGEDIEGLFCKAIADVALMERFGNAECGMGVFEPAADGRHGGDALRLEKRLHRAALGVSADNNVADFQSTDGELNDSADAAEHLAVSGHHVADVAGDEDLAGAGAGDGVGVDARVGAGDEECVRVLAFAGGLHEEFGGGGVDLGLEAAHACFELIENFVHSVLVSLFGQGYFIRRAT